MNIFSKIEKEAKKVLSGSKGCHDFEHTLRVLNLSLHIGKKEKADIRILKLAAILHDIGRKCEDESGGKICHAKEGAKMAKKILKKYGVSDKDILKISHCISAHRFRGSVVPESKEAKVLFDADKLDSIGAVGIGRTFLFAGEVGAKLHNSNVDIFKTKPYTEEDTAYREFVVKLSKIKNRMLTSEGKRLAKERHEFMVKFFERLEKEISAKL